MCMVELCEQLRPTPMSSESKRDMLLVWANVSEMKESSPVHG